MPSPQRLPSLPLSFLFVSFPTSPGLPRLPLPPPLRLPLPVRLEDTGFSTWSHHVNPNSGNLHPTEAHLLSPPLPNGDSPFSSSSFLTHYSSKDHSLEFRARLDLSSLFLDHGGSIILLALSFIFWLEAYKYGKRALRYCNHDVSHALTAVALAAASLD